MAIETSKDDNKKSKEKGSYDDVIHVTKDELKNVVEKIYNDKKTTKTEDLLEGVLYELKSQGDGPVVARSFKEEQIDMDDYLDIPTNFFTYSFSHTCLGDTRFGHSVETPYGRPIKFKPLWRYKKPGSGKYNDQVLSMSCITVRSKKEAEWIRNHTLFGIRYFENHKDAQVDSVFADNLVEQSNMLNAMSQFEVIERAKSEGITITPDIDDVRKRLTYQLAEKELKSQTTRHKVSAADPSFNPSDPSSITQALMNEKDLNKVSL